MPRLDPTLLPVVTDLERGLRELGIPFGIVGALVPELLLEARPARMTNDADVTVVVHSIDEFEALKAHLEPYGFTRTRASHRLQHRLGGVADLLPFSVSLAPTGRLELEAGLVLNMAGFEAVVPNVLQTIVDGGLTLPLAPLPLYALLKLVAFSDRKQFKDLAGVLHCLQHYLEDDERRYGAEHHGEGVPYEYTCAYLLGADGRRFLDAPLRHAATGVLDRFSGPDTEVVMGIAGEKGRVMLADDEAMDVFEHFRWYRLGADL